mmetsp:Transcript_39042/g.76113  ORF Transcript_39042/g.76113 Transcript_39042/m.76113 type:complete len:243 (-) Transcript_39042:54-782(-)
MLISVPAKSRYFTISPSATSMGRTSPVPAVFPGPTLTTVPVLGLFAFRDVAAMRRPPDVSSSSRGSTRRESPVTCTFASVGDSPEYFTSTSELRMRVCFSPSMSISVPSYSPNWTLSPAATGIGITMPVSWCVSPGPIEMTVPVVAFFLADLESMIPPSVCSGVMSTRISTKLDMGVAVPTMARPSTVDAIKVDDAYRPAFGKFKNGWRWRPACAADGLVTNASAAPKRSAEDRIRDIMAVL